MFIARDAKDLGLQKEKYDEAVNDYDKAVKNYESLAFYPGEEEKWKETKVNYDPFSKHLKAVVAALMSGHSQSKTEALALWADSESMKIRFSYGDKIDQMLQFHSKMTEVITKENATMSTVAKSVTLTVVFSAIVLGMVLGVVLSTAISKTLTLIVDGLRKGSEQVAAASEQISESSQELANAASEQASSVEETSASLQEMAGMVENNVRSAEHSAKLVETVKETAIRGNESMETLTESMKEILESNQKIEALSKLIEEVGEKTAIIDEIVFQTKLLSFNASVEAERAGEHGRGFAVVAQEVGNLAQMSGKAALEISSIVKTTIKDAQQISTDNRNKVEKGNELLATVGELLQEMQKNSNTVLESSKQIVNASKEQASGIKQVTVAMDNINKATQGTAATSEEAASAGEELSAQAIALDHLVTELSQLVAGGNEDVVIQSRSSGKKSNISKVTRLSDARKQQTQKGVSLKKVKKIEEVETEIGSSSSDSEVAAWERL
jgi:methyl-accepting chemotaxis protein